MRGTSASSEQSSGGLRPDPSTTTLEDAARSLTPVGCPHWDLRLISGVVMEVQAVVRPQGTFLRCVLEKPSPPAPVPWAPKMKN